jgi:sulfate adenylyltransferase large subunit
MQAVRVQPAPVLDIEAFIKQDEEKDLLRFSTAGSVDDGKSTLIGRLLYDSNAIYEDQLNSVRQSPINRSSGAFDLALLTDGLRAEREQGITIDVAYRYFSTPKRKFIIADTPGHEQYTRNMATGASTANLAIVLVDARNGVLQQSRRHAFIASMLGIQHIVVAVNKMDLVGYSEDVFNRICTDFSNYASRLQVPDLHFIPISALKGDNVVQKSTRMPWFDGSCLLHYLETVHIASDRNMTEFRFPVQYVIRPNLDFRGYAGQVASGLVKTGDPVMVLPSGRTTRVKSIVSYDGDLPVAFPPMSVTLCLEDEIDISRGDMLVPPSHSPHVTRQIDARLVWMNGKPLEAGRTYLLQHASQRVPAAVEAVRYRININTLEKETADTLGLNDIGAVILRTQKPIFCDPYRRNRTTGSFILIDPMTNATVAAGMITGREPVSSHGGGSESQPAEAGRITRLEQQSRAGHRAVTIRLDGSPEIAFRLERALFDANCRVHVLAVSETGSSLAPVCRALNEAGVIALVYGAMDAAVRTELSRQIGEENFLEMETPAGEPVNAAIARLYRELENGGILFKSSPAD